MTLDEEILALETRLLDPAVRRSKEALDSLLADDFVELGSSGRAYDKDAICAALEDEAPFEFDLDRFHCEELSDGVVLLTYRLAVRREGAPEKVSLRSSVWVRRSGGRRLRFHQGTLVPA